MTSDLHPASDPTFGSTILEPVWYMGHPLAPDDRFTFQQNMDHVVHMTRLFYDCGLRVVAPYHTICLALDDTNPEHRRIGLEVDCSVAKALGRIVLCGHKLSTGMKCERAAVRETGYELNILDFIGWKDKDIRSWLDRIRPIFQPDPR
jgi:hypothetical protein